MTTAEIILPGRIGDEIDRREIVRWGICLAVVLALHLGAGLFVLLHRAAMEPEALPPSVVMLELAPLPVAPPVEQKQQVEPVPELPPPPPPPMPQIEPELPPEPQLQLPPEPVLAPKPEVTLPPPPPPVLRKPKPLPKPVERQPPPPPPVRMPAPTPHPVQAPPQAAPMPAPPAAAPAAPAASSATAINARNSWAAQISARLERYKRYPRLAEEQRQEGVPVLWFSIDRSGRVLASRLQRGSGFPLLDQEVLELIQRAQPLPEPPAEMPGSHFELTLPINFSVRRR